MEDALYLSRLAEHVTLIHRRDAFRASKIMVDRVLSTSSISILWNTVVEDVLDVTKGEVTGLKVKNVKSGETSELAIQGLFIAIGHTPNTSIFAGQLELDAEGYLVTKDTRTSVPGVFAAGDVQDRHFKQAITSAGTGCIAALQAERFLATC
jgi:thioredoxin reductase (NADPH)